ncbi:MAG TPA: proton-conducting transporter membrane subunit, partial [Candidatus Krumholzibacterium sp.]|nr:proton-conducting transporter membrane subunit [Candidatus Krumholzibacterium sp.]
MVSPIYIMIVGLAAAFLLPLFEKGGRGLTAAVFLAATGAIAAISIQWLVHLSGGAPEAMTFTAGFRPPFSINLRMGMEEAALSSAAGLAGLSGAVYLVRDLSRHGARSMMLYVLLIMGLDGMILTRDIFNLFVFIEITGIAGYALVAMRQDVEALSAGLKYAMAGAVASIFMLLGIILIYSQTGTLNIDGMTAAARGLSAGTIAAPAVFMLVFAFMIETKQFPANGWAIDVYDRADPGVAAVISAAGSGAALFALYKVLPLAGAGWYRAAAIAGIATFMASNMIALRQDRASRLLGYSSTGQMGLLLAVVAFGLQGRLGSSFYLIAGGLFLNHLLAKAGLFWLSGVTGAG